VSKSDDGVWRVEKALRSALGDRAKSLMHRRSKHLANLTPFEVAQEPHGARIVLVELDNIVRQARHAD
jgi:hypothetical protein